MSLFRKRVKGSLYLGLGNNEPELLAFSARAVLGDGEKRWLGTIRRGSQTIPVARRHWNFRETHTGSHTDEKCWPPAEEFDCSDLVTFMLCKKGWPLLNYDESSEEYTLSFTTSDLGDVYNSSVYTSRSFELNINKGLSSGHYQTTDTSDIS